MIHGDILIIDDNPDNLRILEAILAADGHEVRAARGGEIALRTIAARPPELILLDIMMPEMDGFEVCRRLKENPATRGIPVLFVSALAETEEKLAAFAIGGLDYITKPFAEREVLARVQTHLLLAATQAALLRTNRELTVEMEARRSAEEASRENGFKLFQIVQRIPVPTFVIDREHAITHWNKALENLTGLATAEMIGTRNQWRTFYQSARPTMADLVVDNALEENIARFYDGKYRKSVLTEGTYEAVDHFRLGDAGEKWFFFTAAPLTDSGGTVIGAIETLQDITEQKRAEQRLRESEQSYRQMSITDALTGLYNSRHFFNVLDSEVERARRYETPLSLILLDVDNFKSYNDRYGHPEGDKVLQGLADLIIGNLRAADTGHRYGGEEFTILLPETGGKNALVAAERLREGFEKMVFSPLPDSEVHMSISIGISRYIPGEQPSAFLKRVDACMYEAKNRGKNRVHYGQTAVDGNPSS